MSGDGSYEDQLESDPNATVAIAAERWRNARERSAHCEFLHGAKRLADQKPTPFAKPQGVLFLCKHLTCASRVDLPRLLDRDGIFRIDRAS